MKVFFKLKNKKKHMDLLEQYVYGSWHHCCHRTNSTIWRIRVSISDTRQ